MIIIRSFRVIVALAAALGSFAAGHAAETPARREWTVEGTQRAALMHVPATAKATAAPVIFAFHGHSGTMAGTVKASPFHELWPEAIVIYPQGLNTPGRLSDPEGKRPGWQHAAGDQGDRDLKFFDAMLASLRADYRVDDRRIYATGHSNGGAFTYLLWAERSEQFAAFAPSSATAGKEMAKLKPKPVLHVAGENDPLVKFAWQERQFAALKKINQCGPGEPWEKIHTIYPSKIGAPFVTVIHPGKHEYFRAGPALMVTFFKAHALAPVAGSPAR